MIAESSVNTRVLHLEGDPIFDSIKRKLNLPSCDDSNSHCHDRVNFTVCKFEKVMSPTQAWSIVGAMNYLDQSLSLEKTSIVLSPSKRL